MDDGTTVAPQARLFVGMGGSGLKTLAKFVDLLTEHEKEVANSEVFVAYLLVDTDAGDLALYDQKIRDSYARVHREPIVSTVHLSADITDFASFVSSKLTKGGHHGRLRDVWWYRENRDEDFEPFTAINLKDSPTRGAGQCPLVSTFLAWNQMQGIEITVENLLNTLKNRSVQGRNLQNWTLDVSMVASLAGGTGRGCWHLVASKIREKLLDLNQRAKPIGFFFDSSIFEEDVRREEQIVKLRVNSLTGVSELVAWLRNEYERDTDLPPFQFRLPSLANPDAISSDLIDTTKLSLTVAGEQLVGITGRAPISAAYLIFGAGKQGTLGEASAYYQSVANALYARLFRSTASANINEAGHLNGLGSASISIPIAGIREYVQDFVRQFLPAHFSDSLAEPVLQRTVTSFLTGLEIPEAALRQVDATASNIPQRVFSRIVSENRRARNTLEDHLKGSRYKQAEAMAKGLTSWAKSNQEVIQEFVREDLVHQLWGRRDDAESTAVGGTLQELGLGEAVSQELKGDKGLFHRVYGGSEEIKPVNPLSSAFALLLRQEAVEIPSESGVGRESVNLASYGTKRAIADEALSRLRAMMTVVGKRIQRESEAKKQTVVSPLEELAKARSGLFRTAVSAEEREAIVERVDRWLVSQASAVVDSYLINLLDEALKEVNACKQAYGAVEERLTETAEKEKAKTERSRENHFWTSRDFDKILDPEASSFDQGILSAQVLQATERDDKLVEEFERLMRAHSLVGFEKARERFRDVMQRWVNESMSMPESRQQRKLTDLVHDHLMKMAEQFMLPIDFYESNFGFFETVKRLMRAWQEEMIRCAATPQDIAKLRQVFQNQFGLAFPISVDGGPRELDDEECTALAEEVCKAMAVRLGGRTDPLFQQRFDEGERPLYDNVAVVLPTEARFDKEFAKEIDQLAKQNSQFLEAGQFKATPTYDMLDAGNPYTMVAYATQQFEDWRRDSGMARIASLEYYKMPAVLNWLRACEDPSGASVFLDSKELERFGIKSCRDIYGLGYISPLFVRDRTLKELRWSPWDVMARSANKKNERLDLLAYGLLKPPKAIEGAPAESAKHFHEVLDKAGWEMPLLALPDQDAAESARRWQYTRSAVRHCTEVTATEKRAADNPAFPKGHAHSSIRRCVDELLENDMVAEAIAGEAVIFLSEVLCNDDYADDFQPEEGIKLAFAYLRDRLKAAKSQQTGPAAERMTKLIDELLARVEDLEGLKPEKLREHFEGIRRNTELHSRA